MPRTVLKENLKGIAMRILLVLTLLSTCLTLSAQDIDLPRKSPRASAALTLGYTALSVDYSAPSVEGRTLWGELVPYGEIWRAGANEATTLSFSTEVEIAGQPLPSGAYAFFLLPREDSTWTAIFNRDTAQWGAYGYDPSLDALRVEVEAKFAKTVNQEQLKYEWVQQTLEQGYLLLSWGKLRLYLPIKTNALEQALLNIEEAVAAAGQENRWKVYGQAGEFLLWAGQPSAALQYAQRGLQSRESARGHWLAARAHAALGQYEAALASAKRFKAADREDYYAQNQSSIDALIKAWEAE